MNNDVESVEVVGKVYQRVVIEVRGGVAECTEKPKGVRVIIHDFDNAKVSSPEELPYEPEVYEEDEVIQ